MRYQEDEQVTIEHGMIIFVAFCFIDLLPSVVRYSL